MKNEKTIIHDVIKRHPQFAGQEKEILSLFNETLSEITKTALEGDKVLVKNFGTFVLKKRKQRPRFDQGLKQVVETEPKKILQFIQSNNIFRNEK